MKKQIILNIKDGAFYTTKFILITLLNRKLKKDEIVDPIEILVNADPILEKRLEIPNHKYTNKQLQHGKGVYILFPFVNKLNINGDGVFNITSTTRLNIVEDICEYLDIEIDLSHSNFIKTLMLTLEGIDLRLRVTNNEVKLENYELFSTTDLANLILLTTEPTFHLAKLIEDDTGDLKQIELVDYLENLSLQDENPFRDKTWSQLGKKLILLDKEVPQDVEINRHLTTVTSTSLAKDLQFITTNHLLNLISEVVITGEASGYELPKKEIRFNI